MKFLTKLGLVLTVALVGATASTASAQNLLTNPSFESGYTGYTTFGAGVQLSTPGTDNIAQTGANAAKVFGEFTGCPFPSFDVGGFFQSFAVVAGKDYTFSGSGFVSSADPITGILTCDNNRMIAKIVFKDGGGNELASTEAIVGDANTPQDTWVDFDCTLPAPAGAVTVEALILFLQPGCDEGSVFVDDLSLETSDPVVEANSLANPSFSTPGLAGWQFFGNVFDEVRGTFQRTTGGGAAIFGTFVADSPSGLTQNVAVTAGENVEFSGWTLSTCVEDPIYGGNNNFALARIEFRNAIGDLIGDAEATVADTNSPLGRWTKFSLQTGVPTGATNADVFLLFISPILEGGKFFLDDFRFGEAVATSAPAAPRGVELAQNSPNPFNPKTEIKFSLDRGQRVALRVYDVAGRLVTTLRDGTLGAGSHAVTWNGTNDAGEPVASGVYRYVLDTSLGRTARSMVLLK